MGFGLGLGVVGGRFCVGLSPRVLLLGWIPAIGIARVAGVVFVFGVGVIGSWFCRRGIGRVWVGSVWIGSDPGIRLGCGWVGIVRVRGGIGGVRWVGFGGEDADANGSGLGLVGLWFVRLGVMSIVYGQGIEFDFIARLESEREWMEWEDMGDLPRFTVGGFEANLA